MTEVRLIQEQSPTAHTVVVGPLMLGFSYTTIVAFKIAGESWVVTEQMYSTTTAKHKGQITGIPATMRRKNGMEVPAEEFQQRLTAILDRLVVPEES